MCDFLAFFPFLDKNEMSLDGKLLIEKKSHTVISDKILLSYLCIYIDLSVSQEISNLRLSALKV